MKNKIAFYFDASHLKDFSVDKFQSGLIALSGTDSSLIRVIIGLSERKDFDIVLYVKNLDVFPNLTLNIVNGIEDAVNKARQDQIEVFVFHLKKIEETDKAISLAEKINLNVVVWAQNPIENASLTRLTENKAVKKIVFVEAYDLNHIRHKKGFYKGVILENGIESNIYATRKIELPDNHNLFFLGSLTESKGFHHLAKAWPKILKAVPDAKLFIIGSGKLYNNFNELGPLGIASKEYEEQLMPYIGNNPEELDGNNVKCLGLLDRNEVIDLIYNSKVGCMNPNIFGSLESCSVTSLEVQLCGVPLVAGKAGGNLNTIIDKKTGLLIKDHKNELPQAIIKLLTDDELNFKMRLAAREYISNKYDLDIIIAKWIKFLNDLITGKDLPLPQITPELAEPKLYIKEAIRIVKKVIR